MHYYPFGMGMPGRTFTGPSSSSGGYRYGFNGKENDQESKFQDYGMRNYNPRLGRFLTVDPLTSKYPWLSVYQFASNCPISGIDLDGLELYFSTTGELLGKFGDNLSIRIVHDNAVKTQVKADAKAGLNSTTREYASYRMGNNQLKEILTQHEATATSAVPIGYASVVDAEDKIMNGTSLQAQTVQTPDGYVTTTPEVLPTFTEPTTDAGRDATTIIHSHPISAYLLDTKTGKFSVMSDGEKLGNYSTTGGTITHSIINVENKYMADIDPGSPSAADNNNRNVNGKNYNLVLVGLLEPNKLKESDPLRSNSPKQISLGKSGAKFYKNNFGNLLFTMNIDALKRMQATVDKETEKQKKEEAKKREKAPGS